MKTHTQVNLVKNNVHYTCWIPSENIKIGSIVELQDVDHTGEKYFDSGWEVVGMGEVLPSDYILEHETGNRFFKQRIK